MKPKTMKRLLALPEEQQEKILKQARDRLKNKPDQAMASSTAAKPDATAKSPEQKSTE